MPFEINNTNIPEVIFVNINKFDDERGFFEELYRNNTFNKSGISNKFNQINLSFSKKTFSGDSIAS